MEEITAGARNEVSCVGLNKWGDVAYFSRMALMSCFWGADCMRTVA